MGHYYVCHFVESLFSYSFLQEHKKNQWHSIRRLVSAKDFFGAKKGRRKSSVSDRFCRIVSCNDRLNKSSILFEVSKSHLSLVLLIGVTEQGPISSPLIHTMTDCSLLL